MNGNEVKMEECKEVMVYMWGYHPGTSPEKSPILSPTPVRLSDRIGGGNSWKDICGGGCGFAMAISGSSSIFIVFFFYDFCNFLSRFHIIGSGIYIYNVFVDFLFSSFQDISCLNYITLILKKKKTKTKTKTKKQILISGFLLNH